MTPSLKHMTDTALGAILAITVSPDADLGLRLQAARALLEYTAMGVDFTTADEDAEADIPAGEQSVPADKPKRTRRTKAEIAAAAAAAKVEAEAEASPKDAVLEVLDEATDQAAPEPGFDWDAPEETPITKDEVIALLNRYSAKHPKKGQGAKEAMAKYGSQSLKDISPGDYNSLAGDLRSYLDAA